MCVVAGVVDCGVGVVAGSGVYDDDTTAVVGCVIVDTVVYNVVYGVAGVAGVGTHAGMLILRVMTLLLVSLLPLLAAVLLLSVVSLCQCVVLVLLLLV